MFGLCTTDNYSFITGTDGAGFYAQVLNLRDIIVHETHSYDSRNEAKDAACRWIDRKVERKTGRKPNRLARMAGIDTNCCWQSEIIAPKMVVMNTKPVFISNDIKYSFEQ